MDKEFINKKVHCALARGRKDVYNSLDSEKRERKKEKKKLKFETLRRQYL